MLLVFSSFVRICLVSTQLLPAQNKQKTKHKICQESKLVLNNTTEGTSILERVQFPLNSESFYFFPAPLESQCWQRGILLIYCSMGKIMAKQVRKAKKKVDSHTRHLTLASPAHPHSQTIDNNNLSAFHSQSTTNQLPSKEQFGSVWLGVLTHINHFFNNQKYYTLIQLEYSFLCLATALSILGPRAWPQLFSLEFKTKLKKYILSLDVNHPNYQVKIQGIFFILVGLIYHPRSGKNQQLKQVGERIFSDRGLLNAFIALELPKNTRISKLYGIIMLTITSRNHTRRTRQYILASVLRNLGAICHQPTLFNLLAYLRSQKNEVSIHIEDLKKGQVLQKLTEGYQSYFNHYQSFYFLDYLHHLIGLFPVLTAKAISPKFAAFLIGNLQVRSFHHPMHENIILLCLGKGMKFHEDQLQTQFIDKLCSTPIEDAFMHMKVAKLLVENADCQRIIIQLQHQGYLYRFLSIMKEKSQMSMILSSGELIKQINQKLKDYSPAIGKYLISILREKLGQMPDDEEVRQLLESVDSISNQ